MPALAAKMPELSSVPPEMLALIRSSEPPVLTVTVPPALSSVSVLSVRVAPPSTMN